MTIIDITALQEQARTELAAEAMETAKEKLKMLYQTEAKADLALKNIRRQIEAYLNEVSELSTYEAAGVNVSAGAK